MGPCKEEHGVCQCPGDLVDSDVGCSNGTVTPGGNIHCGNNSKEICISCEEKA